MFKFYNRIKEDLSCEPYVQLQDQKKIKSIAWLRTSSHRLKIETGRYGTSTSLHHRVCNFCSSGDKETLELLFSLITAEPIIEDEDHFLRDCPNYNQLREERSKELKELLIAKKSMELFSERHIFESSSFIFKLFKIRFDLV